jgi:hypothetical protein
MSSIIAWNRSFLANFGILGKKSPYFTKSHGEKRPKGKKISPAKVLKEIPPSARAMG